MKEFLFTARLHGGVMIAVAPLTFNRARLTIGTDLETYDDAW